MIVLSFLVLAVVKCQNGDVFEPCEICDYEKPTIEAGWLGLWFRWGCKLDLLRLMPFDGRLDGQSFKGTRIWSSRGHG